MLYVKSGKQTHHTLNINAFAVGQGTVQICNAEVERCYAGRSFGGYPLTIPVLITTLLLFAKACSKVVHSTPTHTVHSAPTCTHGTYHTHAQHISNFTYHPLTTRVDTREMYLEQAVGKH